MDAEAPALGRLLRTQRERRGLTQEALAERAGGDLSARTLRRIERGQTRPYQHTLETLASALDLEPEERRSLLAAWRAQPASVAAAPPPGGATLPAPLTPLVGREREEAAVAELLRRPRARLVTLTGPGGVGKTRLALQVASGMHDAFPDGVAWVDLASVRDEALVLPTIAASLGLREEGGRPATERLRARLREARLLLVLDNLEQVVGAAPALAALLEACPGVAALATSRAVLRVRGEQDYPVPPLALPAPDRMSDLATLAQAPAVALFLARGQAVRPGLALTEETAEAVVGICTRLDGLPLALELAAARLRLFTPQALLARLERRLPLLVGGPRDLPARQQTLQDTLAWSYDLLDPGAQALLRRLSVFAGGCTLDAVEALCAATGVPGGAALEELTALRDQSLIRLADDAAGEPRVLLLETIRDYALERLATAGEEEPARAAHAAYYLALAESAAPEVTSPRQPAWLERLEREHDNLRVALTWARDGGAATTGRGLRLATALAPFWWTHGHYGEGRGWLETFLARTKDDTGAEASPLRARALEGAGRLALEQGDYGAARAALEESLARYVRLADRAAQARVLTVLGRLWRDHGHFALARTLHEESLALYRMLGDRDGLAFALTNLGLLAYVQGAYAQAAHALEESIDLYRQGEDMDGRAFALAILALVAQEQGDSDRAIALGEEALTLARAVGSKRSVGLALLVLGSATGAQGAAARAVPLLEESVRVCTQIGYLMGQGLGQAALAWTLQARGESAEAATRADAALALFDGAGLPWGVLVAQDARAEVAAARGDLGRAATLWRECLALAQRLGSTWGVARCLEGVAALALAREQPGLAARLAGAAAGLRQAQGMGRAPDDPDAPSGERTRAMVRAALGAVAGDAAWRTGRELTAEQAIAEALALEP